MKKGFSLIELLVVIAIIGVLASIIISTVGPMRDKARDAKRKAEVSQMGRLLLASCYTPDAGAGEYDIKVLAPELTTKYPQYASYISQIPEDPSTGTVTLSKYIYTVNSAGKCALYANLENKNEAVTLNSISVPTPGAGTGVLSASTDGWNGSPIYFQVSN